MTEDPMDTPPADHGSDRYDYIEIQAPQGIRPPDALMDRLLEACPDCRPNVFVRLESGSLTETRTWQPTIAHDDGCPTFARIEGR